MFGCIDLGFSLSLHGKITLQDQISFLYLVITSSSTQLHLGWGLNSIVKFELCLDSLKAIVNISQGFFSAYIL